LALLYIFLASHCGDFRLLVELEEKKEEKEEVTLAPLTFKHQSQYQLRASLLDLKDR
jgi:hypothetical protein